MNSFAKSMIKAILAVVFVVGFFMFLGSVGTMDVNAMQGVPDESEVILKAIIGATMMIISLLINEQI